MAKPKQIEVPGTERVQDAELRTLAEDFDDLRVERSEHRKKTQAALEEKRDRLIAKMEAKGLTAYADDHVKIMLETTKKLTVERVVESEREQNVTELADAKAARRAVKRPVQDRGKDVEP